jgi:hypothetical protein
VRRVRSPILDMGSAAIWSSAAITFDSSEMGMANPIPGFTRRRWGADGPRPLARGCTRPRARRRQADSLRTSTDHAPISEVASGTTPTAASFCSR